MTFGRTATRTHRLAIATLGAALAVSGAMVASPASAQVDADAAPVAVDCPRGTAGSHGPASGALRLRHDGPGSEVSAATAARVQREIDQTARAYRISSGTAARSTTTATGTATAAMRVPVWIHVIHGSHRGDRNVGRPAALNLYRQLKNGFNGGQNPRMAGSGVTFVLRGVDVRKSDRWFHAAPLSAADNQMKRALHRGHGWVLNIYLKAPKYAGDVLLGYSRFPWQYRFNPKLDGVTVNVDSMTGGRFRGYNYGDTVIHETGHWFGLLHTFEGFSCSGSGDGVADTPAESVPAAGCPLGRDSCTAVPGVDPVTNFMDYGYDTCMNTFTPGQQARMRAAFFRYRYRVQ